MKSTELRIGNYLQDAKGKLAPVEGLSKNKIKAYSGMVTEIPLKPIPLTEEWLLKFGWRYYNGRTSGNLTMDTPCKVDLDFIDGKMQIKSHYEPFYRDLNIKYVHQLQNLYFALTGEELTINN